MGDREDGKNFGEAKQEETLGKKEKSCSLCGRTAVAEEITDDCGISHCRCVPQIMIVLCNLPEHSPHDFS